MKKRDKSWSSAAKYEEKKSGMFCSIHSDHFYSASSSSLLFRSAVCFVPFIQTISIVPLQVHFYSEALPTQHGYCAGVSRQSATGKGCELRTCPRSLRDG